MEINTFDEAVTLLKKIVKFSHLDGQKHMDLSVCTAEERPYYERALMIIRAQVAQGHMTDAEVKEKLGLV